MRLEQAQQIKVGQKLHNVFLEEVVVTSIYSPSDAGDVIVFGTVNTRLHKEGYSFEDLYCDLEEICDEERSFIGWAKENREFVLENEDSFKVMKKSYMAGFGNGFAHKQSYTYEEQMQK
jgi:hypothetical protein